MNITKMTPELAAALSSWHYPGEYALYDFSTDDDTMRELLNGDYYACLSEDGAPTGFACFGASARIPTREAEVYVGDAVDIGIGMRPDLCGRGGGAAFFSQIVRYAQAAYPGRGLRLTVAAFNERAVKVYRRCGFAPAQTVTHANSNAAFLVMLYEENA